MLLPSRLHIAGRLLQNTHHSSLFGIGSLRGIHHERAQPRPTHHAVQQRSGQQEHYADAVDLYPSRSIREQCQRNGFGRRHRERHPAPATRKFIVAGSVSGRVLHIAVDRHLGRHHSGTDARSSGPDRQTATCP